MLTLQTIERRMRRHLAKRGYTLHKSRKGGYIVTGGPYPDEPDGYYEDIDKLVDAVEQMDERFVVLDEQEREKERERRHANG